MKQGRGIKVKPGTHCAGRVIELADIVFSLLVVTLFMRSSCCTALRSCSGNVACAQEGDPVDVRGYLHRDGSVIMPVSVEDLQNPQTIYQEVGGTLHAKYTV